MIWGIVAPLIVYAGLYAAHFVPKNALVFCFLPFMVWMTFIAGRMDREHESMRENRRAISKLKGEVRR